jgi:hypothetical protein
MVATERQRVPGASPDDHTCAPADRIRERRWILHVLPDGTDPQCCYVYTVGLTWYGRPELVMYDVPRYAQAFAVLSVRNLAQRSLDGPSLEPGQAYPVEVDDLRAVVLGDGEDPDRPLLECRRLLGDGFGVQRLEPDDADLEDL